MSEEKYISKDELKSTVTTLYYALHMINEVFFAIFADRETGQDNLKHQRGMALDAFTMLRGAILELENIGIMPF